MKAHLLCPGNENCCQLVGRKQRKVKGFSLLKHGKTWESLASYTEDQLGEGAAGSEILKKMVLEILDNV